MFRVVVLFRERALSFETVAQRDTGSLPINGHKEKARETERCWKRKRERAIKSGGRMSRRT